MTQGENTERHVALSLIHFLEVTLFPSLKEWITSPFEWNKAVWFQAQLFFFFLYELSLIFMDCLWQLDLWGFKCSQCFESGVQVSQSSRSSLSTWQLLDSCWGHKVPSSERRERPHCENLKKKPAKKHNYHWKFFFMCHIMVILLILGCQEMAKRGKVKHVLAEIKWVALVYCIDY